MTEPSIREDQVEKYAETIRKLIEHENIIQNYRFTWLTTIQGLLFAALGFSWDKGTTGLVFIIAALGIIVAISAASALRLSDQAYGNLSSWWYNNLSGYNGPPRHGFDVGGSNRVLVMFLPSRIMPVAFLLAWIAVVLHRCLSAR